MSKEQKAELKEKGFIIVEWWHVIAAIITVVFLSGVFFANTQSGLSTHEKRLEKIEQWDSKHEAAQNISNNENNVKINELIIYNKLICTRLGIPLPEKNDIKTKSE